MATWIFAAVFTGMALLFTMRLLAARQDISRGGVDRGADASHGVMSLGMAAMFWPWGNPLPARYGQLLFSVVAALFAFRLLQQGPRSATISQPDRGRGADLHHVLGSLAMVYMLAASPAAQHMGHGMNMPGPGITLPVLAWAFVAYFLVFAVWLAAGLIEPASTGAVLLGGGPRGVITSPHLLGSCRIFMGIGMSSMLVTML
ncbi:MAG: DUF5134 domain-containing protein [Pseudonocardiaceae bacterium]